MVEGFEWQGRGQLENVREFCSRFVSMLLLICHFFNYFHHLPSKALLQNMYIHSFILVIQSRFRI